MPSTDPTQLAQRGAEEAALALSQLLRTPFSADPPRAMDAAALAAAHRGEVIVVSFDTSGGIDGRLAVIFDDDVARWMAGRLTGGGPVEGVFGEVALAALAELGNIAASAFLNSAARAVKRTCLPSVPRVDRAPAAAALSSAVPAASSSTAVLRAEGHSLHLVFAPSAA